MVSVMPSLEHTFSSPIDKDADEYDQQGKRQRLDNDIDGNSNHRIVGALSESSSFKDDSSPLGHEEDLLLHTEGIERQSMAISSSGSPSHNNFAVSSTTTHTEGPSTSSTSSSSSSENHWLSSSEIVVKGEAVSTPSDNLIFGENVSTFSPTEKSSTGDLYPASYILGMQAYPGPYVQPNLYSSMQSTQHTYSPEYMFGTTRNQTSKSATSNSLQSSCLQSNLGSSSPYISPYASFGSTGSQAYQNPYYPSSYNTAAFSNACTSQNYSNQQGLDSTYYPAAAAAAAAAYTNNPVAAAAAANSYYCGSSYAGYGGGATNGSSSHSPLSSTSLGNSALSGTPTQAATYQLALPPNGSLDENGPAYQGVESPSSPLKDSNSRTRTARARRGNPSPEPENKVERVYIWDLDETIIVFHSLLTGEFAKLFRKDHNMTIDRGYAMEKLVLEFADAHFFFSELEDCDQVHIDDVSSDDNGQDLSTYNFSTDGFTSVSNNNNPVMGAGLRGGVDWMRKLAFRYRKIKETYNTYRNDPGSLMGAEAAQSWRRLRADIETLTDSWLTEAMRCLELVDSRPNSVNILVTSTQLVPALSKILTHNLGGIFPIENVYSATKVGKENCFERIQTRFSKKPVFIAIGDTNQEQAIAKKMDFPFWRIESHRDFGNLYRAMNQCGM